MRLLLMALMVSILSGCAGVHYQYGDIKPKDNEIAKLRKSPENSMWTPLLADYIELENKPLKWKTVGDEWIGYPVGMNMLPGKYRIRFKCSSASNYAFPYADVHAEAGKTYTARCFKAANDMVGVEIKESPKT
ncbi:hypothetical protein [Ferrimonas sp. YFM]|uniref:hypothetical protein n=1 Tax=Ferrimonas sp. YFM TaxID=3028878 RepID=UPI00257369C7|nr:hypothetical protein [Ferrimonas sp. YFM]